MKRSLVSLFCAAAISGCGGGSGSNEVIEQVDTQAPALTLVGGNQISINIGDSYVEQGVSVVDNSGTSITPTVSGTVDTTKVGQYVITYTAVDPSGNSANITRTVSVVDNVAPVITLNGEAEVTLDYQANYTEAGASALDNVDGDITVTIAGDVDTSILNTYPITYSASDSAGNVSTLTRHVIVDDLTKPVITLNGATTVNVMRFHSYEDAGATVADNYDVQVSVTVNEDAVDTSTVGSYSVTYSSVDSSGNAADVVTRTVNVLEQAPLIASFDTTGNNTVTLEFDENGSTVEVDWGEGYVEVSSPASYTFGGANSNQVKIRGVVNELHFCTDISNAADNTKLTNIDDWGQLVWLSMEDAFHDCNDFNNAAPSIGSPDLTTSSDFVSMESTFEDSNFNKAIGDWDVSNVNTMRKLFRDASFNQNISQWNVANVVKMGAMFSGSPFNQDIGQWDVSKVTSMASMFSNTPFDHNIGQWDVSNVNNMDSMFNAASFSQDISQWDVSNLVTMGSMFFNTAHSHDLSNWNISKVHTMTGVFDNAALSTAHYSAMLLAWSELPVQNGVSFSANNTSLSADAAVQAAKAKLVNDKGWTVTDKGL